jgi:hypothetical protein
MLTVIAVHDACARPSPPLPEISEAVARLVRGSKRKSFGILAALWRIDHCLAAERPRRPSMGQ